MALSRLHDFRALPAGVPPTLQIDVCTITPDDALEFLETMPKCQRPLKTGYLRMITAQLARGEFPFTPAPIIFDTNGQMIDGQHRCTAIVNAGVAMPAIVVRGVHPKTYAYLDQGAKRTLSDMLVSKKHATSMAATIEMVAAWERRGGKISSSSGLGPQDRLSQAEKLDVMDRHPDVAHSVQMANGLWRMPRGTVSTSTIAFLHYVFSRKHMTEADRFFDGLKFGENLPGDSPILLLRNRVLTATTERASIKRSYMTALIIKAWNAFLSGKPVRVLRVKDEENYPQPL